MNYKNILITGGAGFVGSSIAVYLKVNYPHLNVVVLDNLTRKGSELNIERLKKYSIDFYKGDVRFKADLEPFKQIDLMIECSAEPSVLSGSKGSPEYVLDTNLVGALNCVECCRKANAAMLFLSTSRVYPVEKLSSCQYEVKGTRFELSNQQAIPGVSVEGISENFPLEGYRSFYGSSKYAAELILEEYRKVYDFPIIINRCGVLAGPWQFGKIDQGIVCFWLASHLFGRSLKYIGFEGTGKQVRDILHVNDLCRLVDLQLKRPDEYSRDIYNVGGGREVSVSLLELTALCESATNKKIEIASEPEMRYADIPVYITDNDKIHQKSNWRPEFNSEKIIEDTLKWLVDNPDVHSCLK